MQALIEKEKRICGHTSAKDNTTVQQRNGWGRSDQLKGKYSVILKAFLVLSTVQIFAECFSCEWMVTLQKDSQNYFA